MSPSEPLRLTDRDAVLVNRFHFCAHGFEVCNLCECDARMANDQILQGTFDPEKLEKMSVQEMMDKMMKGMMEASNFEKELRAPLSIADLVLDTGELEYEDDGSVNYNVWACKPHSRKNCIACFDWRGLINAEQNKKNDSSQERERVLAQLRAMNVKLPAGTKLPLDELEKKLSVALSLVQDLSDRPVDPSKLRAWKGKEPLLDAFKKGNLAEAYANLQSQSEGRGPLSFPLYENAFVDLRQTVMHIANNYEKGQQCCTLQDNTQREAICIRVLGVHDLNGTPLISLVYGIDDGPSMTKVFEFNDAQRKAGAKGFARIHSTIEEQALFRRLLQVNAENIPSGLTAELKPEEQGFKASFIVPVAPLSQVQIGKLTTNLGCPICGKSANSRCAACHSISYCGPVCQKTHWKEHKAQCKRIRGGTWLEATFSENPIVNGQQKYAGVISHTANKMPKVRDSLGPPDNVHGDKAFLVKVQRPLMMWADGYLSMLVYDRNRTFQGNISKQENPKFWEAAMKQMPEGSSKVKIYRNARRTGDWTLSVCVDSEPSEIPQW
ncbi:unnamed protein product [Peniophora sp. CBMAI 1063]|nr:unnamed protein product [Peniophora sp. CBMAI 1063]